MKIQSYRHVILAALCLMLFAQLYFSAMHVSATSDEFPHLASGYAALVTGDLRMETEHPPLLKAIAALPLLAFDLRFPCGHPSWKTGRHFEYYKQLLFVYNKNADELLFYARIPMMLLSVLLLLLVYLWAGSAFGAGAGLFAAFLYAFEPNLLGHGSLVMTDVGFALFAFASSYAFWRFASKPSIGRWILFAVVFGLTQLTKFTAVFLVPMFALVIIATSFLKPEPTFHRFLSRLFPAVRKWPRACTLVVHSLLFAAAGVISILLINWVYGFEGSFQTVHDIYMNDVNLDKTNFDIGLIENINPAIKFALTKIPNPLPYYYTKGFGYNVFWDAVKEWPRALFGEVRTSAFYSYYLFLLLFRLPITILVFIALALLVKKGRIVSAHLLIPVAFFVLLFSVASRQGNIRYIIQIFPFLLVFASGIVNHPFLKRTSGKLIFATLCIAYIASSVTTYPEYLSYFNEFLPGNTAHAVFQDTNLQIGQHFYLLQDYIKENPARYGILYPYRMDVMEFYNLSVYPLPSDCTAGKHIVDELAFYYSPERTSWLAGKKPIDRIGTTLLVFDAEC